MINLHKITAVCFDAGNVLIALNFDRIQKILEQHGMQVSREEFAAAELAGRNAINNALRQFGSIINSEQGRYYYGEILRRLGVPEDRVEAVKATVYAEGRKCNLWNSSPEGTLDAVRAIRDKGYRIGVISNAGGDCEETLESLGFGGLFEFVIDSHVVGVEKPDRRIFEMAVEKFGVPASEVLYIGDIYHIDVVGSSGAGMQSGLIQPQLVCTFGECFMIRNLGELAQGLPEKTGIAGASISANENG
jgi:putative hydrolase of the HAD superfamily